MGESVQDIDLFYSCLSHFNLLSRFKGLGGLKCENFIIRQIYIKTTFIVVFLCSAAFEHSENK